MVVSKMLRLKLDVCDALKELSELISLGRLVGSVDDDDDDDDDDIK